MGCVTEHWGGTCGGLGPAHSPLGNVGRSGGTAAGMAPPLWAWARLTTTNPQLLCLFCPETLPGLLKGPKWEKDEGMSNSCGWSGAHRYKYISHTQDYTGKQASISLSGTVKGLESKKLVYESHTVFPSYVLSSRNSDLTFLWALVFFKCKVKAPVSDPHWVYSKRWSAPKDKKMVILSLNVFHLVTNWTS